MKSSGTADLDQDRVSNKANEITDITETTGGPWTTPAYDAAGNATKVPLPGNPLYEYDCKYDAWNRLVKLEFLSFPIADYEYDGLNRRMVYSIYFGGSLNSREHYYYNQNWQVLETRKEVSGTESPDPLEQNVWHPYYIDALATRFFDENTNGILTENNDGQHYFTHDANFNVTAVINTTGAVIERYEYTAYGQLTILDANFIGDSNNLSDILNAYTYTGRRYDPYTSLYYYRARYYHYALGRFVTRDPIGYEGSQWNLYEYVGSNPVVRLDALGLDATDFIPFYATWKHATEEIKGDEVDEYPIGQIAIPSKRDCLHFRAAALQKCRSSVNQLIRRNMTDFVGVPIAADFAKVGIGTVVARVAASYLKKQGIKVAAGCLTGVGGLLLTVDGFADGTIIINRLFNIHKAGKAVTKKYCNCDKWR